MASCERIAPILQAYVDDELAPWERLMVEHHVHDCVICQEELREVTTSSAALFESLAPYRLPATFHDRVMNRLPAKLVGALGSRGAHVESGHASKRIERLSWWTLAGAVAVLVLAFAIIVYKYPEPIQPVQIGMVTGVDGASKMAHAYEEQLRDTVVRELVFSGDRFVTSSDGKLILALEGRSEIRVNVGTELWTDNERFIRLVRGEMWGRVAGGNRVFTVQTRNGDITVTGTEFNIRATHNVTTVAVARGKVLFETAAGFTEVTAGQTSSAEAGLAPRQVQGVPAVEVGTWARDVVPQTTDSRYSMVDEREGRPGDYYMSKAEGRMRVVDVLIRRDAYGTAPLSLPGSFTVCLYNDRMEEIARRRLSLSEFTGTSERIRVDFSEDNIVVDNRHLFVLFNPDAEALKWLRVRTDIDDLIKIYMSEKVN